MFDTARDFLQVSALSAMYLLSRILHVVRQKSLVNAIAAALLQPGGSCQLKLIEDREAVRHTPQEVKPATEEAEFNWADGGGSITTELTKTPR